VIILKIKHFTYAFLLLSLASVSAFASSATEAETLARIEHELTALDALVQQAQTQADADARIQFDYKALEADLDLVKQGIRRHVLAPREQPRSYPALKGDYR